MSYSKKGGGLMGRRRKKPKTDMDDGKKEATGTTSKTGAQLRITADFNDLDLPDNVKLIMDEKKNMMDFHMDIHVDMGHWKDAKYKFHFQIPKK